MSNITEEEALTIAKAFGMTCEVNQFIKDGYEPWQALYEWDLPISIEEFNNIKL